MVCTWKEIGTIIMTGGVVVWGAITALKPLVDSFGDFILKREQSAKLKAERLWREEIKRIKPRLRRFQNAYFVQESIPGHGKGPWCSVCLDSSEKLIVLHVNREPPGGHCPACHTSYPEIFATLPHPS